LAITPNSTQSLSKPKAWKKRHADVIIMLMRGYSANGKLSHKLIGHSNEKFCVSRATICGLWKNYRQAIIGGEAPKLTRKSRLGRKMKHALDDLKGRIRDVSFHKRKMLHSLSHATGIPHSTLHQYFKKGII
jgi:hypothetical protein